MKRTNFSAMLTLLPIVTLALAQEPPTGVAGDHPGGAADTLKTTSGAVRISERVAKRLLVKKVQVSYPQAARQQRVQGDVVLRVLIDTNGDVKEVALLSGHPVLARAALDAVKKWKYKPYMLNGHPVDAETQVTVNFEIEVR
jgi:protein TonB